jgi:RNA recognition motif-containing protein
VLQKGDTAGAKQLSMGFGFVEYSSTSAAKEALRLMKGFVLEGHTLEV